MIRNPFQWLNTVVTEPHYFFHFLVFFSYLPIRISASSIFLHDVSLLLLRREIQAILAFTIFSVVRMVREETWEGVIADTLLFGKAFLLLLALYVDYHLALWYMVAFLVLYILSQQPAFPELGVAKTMTPLQLESTLIEGVSSRYWLVEFRTLSSSTCVRNSRNFPELSVTYVNDNLSFGVVDLGLFPNVADKFGISLKGNVGLPAYILFENATEVTRYPKVDFDAKVFHPSVTKEYLSRHFELDRLLLEYVHSK
ncbi:thioredoxin-related transmembrane protein 2 homolog [Chenopodium quinoa]|uniref:thioredoxin-related transmembrane protein 2 homolog n=1 Tax=Chenopodium quinoa TaxID=63459 RepID=UPI000B786DAC|nr:thioredoxin-related transmembrane protein 2 homolog [Chenopodium quinoa]